MKPFNTSTARATALGCLATLMFAAPVTAEESSGSFGTDIDANPNQQGIVERTATTAVPTSVVETGAGINGNDSLTDTAGGIATAVNKGAEQAKQEAQAEINQLKAKCQILKTSLLELLGLRKMRSPKELSMAGCLQVHTGVYSKPKVAAAGRKAIQQRIMPASKRTFT